MRFGYSRQYRASSKNYVNTLRRCTEGTFTQRKITILGLTKQSSNYCNFLELIHFICLFKQNGTVETG